ncbi:MAG: cytidine deaminase [Methylobacteriaceae bacterium]|nr:cytidine deaminase [Methylobacteriaceae bacterium]
MPDDRLPELLSAARAARSRAYAPYSGYQVGAAILSAAGGVHAGCNVENAAYPVGTCAEAGALAAMVAAGDRRIAAVLIVADGPALVAPCGACRQRLREFASDDAPVHLADASGVRRTVSVGELLPLAFGPDTLAGREHAG